MNRGTLQWSSLFCECSERLCILRLSWAGCVKLSFFPCLPSFCGFHLLTTTWFSIVVSISLPRYLPDRIHWNTFLWWWYAQIWYKFSSASCVKSAISQWYTVNFYECVHFCWMNGKPKKKKKKRNHILISETSKSHWFQKFSVFGCQWNLNPLQKLADWPNAPAPTSLIWHSYYILCYSLTVLSQAKAVHVFMVLNQYPSSFLLPSLAWIEFQLGFKLPRSKLKWGDIGSEVAIAAYLYYHDFSRHLFLFVVIACSPSLIS